MGKEDQREGESTEIKHSPNPEKAEQEHRELLESVKLLSRDMEDKYDEKIKKLQGEEVEENPEFEKLQKVYEELHSKMGEARKAGKDVFIAWNTLLKFPAQLQMAKATGEDEDLDKARKVIQDARKEYEGAIQKNTIDVRKEIEERVRREMEKEKKKEEPLKNQNSEKEELSEERKEVKS